VIVTIFITALCGAMILGMPIAFALLVSSVAMMVNLDILDTRILAQSLIAGADSFPLMAIPFFMLVGELMNAGGISKRIVNFGMSMVGHVRGGLGYVAIIAGFVFAGLCGSAVADTAAIVAIMVPMMASVGYNKARSAALIAAGGCIAPIIPPSISFIVFGAITGVSIMKLFMAGIFPGILIASALAVTWWHMCRKEDLKVLPKQSYADVWKATKESFWALFLPIFLITVLRSGVVTPTEAGVLAVAYTLVICLFVYRGLTLAEVGHVLVKSAKTTSIIMFLIAGAVITARLIALGNVPAVLIHWMDPFMDSPIMLMFIINIILFIVGTALDLTPTVLILAPVMMPVIEKAGIDPIYFGVIFVLNGAIGLITPPVGTVLNAACGACNVSMDELFWKVIPFLAVETAVMILLIVFPDLILVPLKWLS
jgi:tripartite ATP-independent transporter DctM subunit